MQLGLSLDDLNSVCSVYAMLKSRWMTGTPQVGLDKCLWCNGIEIRFVRNVPGFVVGVCDIHFLLKRRAFLGSEGIWSGVACRSLHSLGTVSTSSIFGSTLRALLSVVVRLWFWSWRFRFIIFWCFSMSFNLVILIPSWEIVSGINLLWWHITKTYEIYELN